MTQGGIISILELGMMVEQNKIMRSFGGFKSG
jgi:hypothetical protein